MAEIDIQTIRTSDDPRALKRAAIGLAGSRDPDEVAFLGVELASGTLVEKLDSEEAYQGTWRRLRLARVMKTLMDSENPASDEVLFLLTLSEPFKSHTLRLQLLIHALRVVKPLRPEAIRFLEAHATPGNPLAFDVVETLSVNQTPEAMDLLAATLISRHERKDKEAWMQQIIMPRRNDMPLLVFCERMFKEPQLSQDLKASLAEALFDYKPDDWFRDCNPPEAPPRAEAGNEAKDLLRRMGLFAQTNLPLSEEQRTAVTSALSELGV